MEMVNAIAKVRFASARPQHVHLFRREHYEAQLICMESGQQAKVTAGPWTYYVITGRMRLEGAGESVELGPGQIAATGPSERHSLVNTGEERLVCLAIGPGGGR